MSPRFHVIFGAMLLVLVVLAVLTRSWLSAAAMLLLLLGQVLAYYSARGRAGER